MQREKFFQRSLIVEVGLPFLGTLSPSPHDQGTKPVSSELKVSLLRFPSPFLESMKHVDAFGELGHIEDSMFQSSVDADFLNTGGPR